MALNSARQLQLTRGISKVLSPENIHALAGRLNLGPLEVEDPSDASALAVALVGEAKRRGRPNTLIKALLRQFPGEKLFAGVLVRDSRFSGETSPGVGPSPIQAALNMRQVLGSWKPTHILPLASDLMAFSTLLEPRAKLLHPGKVSEDHTEILSTLTPPQGEIVRLLLVAADKASMDRARSISGVFHGSETLQTRIVQGVRFQEPAARSA